MAGTEMKVSVESFIIHEELRKFIQKVWDDHKIRIENIDTRWLKIEEMSEIHNNLRELVISTKSYG